MSIKPRVIEDRIKLNRTSTIAKPQGSVKGTEGLLKWVSFPPQASPDLLNLLTSHLSPSPSYAVLPGHPYFLPALSCICPLLPAALTAPTLGSLELDI